MSAGRVIASHGRVADLQPEPAVDAPRLRAGVRHTLGLTWVVGAAAITMLPALLHGVQLGPYDLLAKLGLGAVPHGPSHSALPFDQITEFIPWTNLAWTQVHQGHLPLWNPYSVLGTPLAFNWQSATFSIPSLIGYLGPLRLAYTVSVLVTLVIAGTGAYVLGRVLGLSVIGCAMAGTAFELSGAFMAWLGWPIAAVMSWAGWLFAAAILVVRGRHRIRSVSLLAITIALAFYAGQIDMLVLLFIATALFLAVLLGLRRRRGGAGSGLLRPAGDLVVSGAAGFALAAPLALPGFQLALKAVRSSSVTNQMLPPHVVLNVLFQGFNGLPWTSSQWFDNVNYLESVAYVGVIVVVLALAATGLRRWDPEVTALAVVALVMAALAYFSPMVSLVEHLPWGAKVQWHRALLPMCFALSVLAGVGADLVARDLGRRRTRRWAGSGFGACAVLLLVLWVFARGELSPSQATIRAQSFVWPALATVVGAVAVGVPVLLRRARRRTEAPPDWWGTAGRRVAAALLVAQTAALVAAGVDLWPSSSTPLTASPAEAALQRAVGSSVVGFGPGCIGVGIPQEVNVALKVKEFAAYDPLLPKAYFTSWAARTGQTAHAAPSSFLPRSDFCPQIQSAADARLYGIAYVLEPAGYPGPSGGVFERTVGDEQLYRIPGAALATLSPVSDDTLPPDDAPGTPVHVSEPGPASWRLVTEAGAPQVLRLRLTDVPGWHATIDGKPLKLERFSGIMLQARVPPGRHSVELHYWPSLFTLGIVAAVCAALALALATPVNKVRRRHGLGITANPPTEETDGS